MDLCKHFINFICYLFWWLLFLTISPIILIIFSLLFIWKFIIIESIAKLSISKTIQRLDSFDSILATDSFWLNPLAAIGLVLIVDGEIDIEQFREHFKQTILEAKTSTGKLIYKKLITIPIEFGGYFFWKNCAGFEIEKHINWKDLPEGINKPSNNCKTTCWNETLESFYTIQTKVPFPNGMPLWDITILSNTDCTLQVGNIKSAVYLRFHHSIADGYTVIKLVDRLTGLNNCPSSGKSPKITKELAKRNVFQTIIRMVESTFMAPSIIGHFYLDNVFHSDIFTKKKSSTDFLISWTSISLSELKSIRQKTKTRFPSLGISLLCGSLYKHFNCPSKLQNTRVMVPLPWPKRPTHKMVNHWTMGIVEASCNNSACERLKITDTNFSAMLKSGTPSWCRLIGPKFLTLLPKSFLKFIVNSNRIGNGIIFTSVPGSSEKGTVNLLGKQVQNMIPMIGTQYSQTGIVCVIFTYNGKANCTIAGNMDLVQNQENMNNICNEFIHKELESLLNDVECMKEVPVPVLIENMKLLHEIV